MSKGDSTISKKQNNKTSTTEEIPKDISKVDLDEEYIDRLVRYVYGDKDRKKVLNTVLSLSKEVQHHITKQKVSHESGVDLQTMYNKSIISVLADFGIVEPTEKVNKQGEYYISINDYICCWLRQKAGEHAVVDAPDNGEYPYAQELITRFGERLYRWDLPFGSTKAPTPLETRMEVFTRDYVRGSNINVTIFEEGQVDETSSSRNSQRYEFEHKGQINGIIEVVQEKELTDFLRQTMVSRVEGALHSHRIGCPCKSIKQHLMKVYRGREDVMSGNTHHVEVVSASGIVCFETYVTNIKPA